MCFEKDILYTCEKREYGIAACGGILPRQHKERDAVSQFGSSNYGINRTNIRLSRLGIFRGVLGLWKKWIKEKGS